MLFFFIITEYFSRTSNSLEDSKKVALYYLANLTFRVYFKASDEYAWIGIQERTLF